MQLTKRQIKASLSWHGAGAWANANKADLHVGIAYSGLHPTRVELLGTTRVRFQPPNV